MPLEFFEFSDPLGSKQIRASGKNLAKLDKGRPEEFKNAADTLGMFKVRNLICILPTHDLAGSFGRGFKTHVFEKIPEAGNAEDPDNVVKSIKISNFGLVRHRGWTRYEVFASHVSSYIDCYGVPSRQAINSAQVD